MAITRITNAAAIIAVDTLAALFDVGGAGRIDIMSGTQPADVDTDITTQTVLATLPLSATAFAGATDQTGYARAAANAITSDTSAAGGDTATWFRAYSGAGTRILDGDVGLTVGSALVLDAVEITVNDTVTVNSWFLIQSET